MKSLDEIISLPENIENESEKIVKVERRKKKTKLCLMNAFIPLDFRAEVVRWKEK